MSCKRPGFEANLIFLQQGWYKLEKPIFCVLVMGTQFANRAGDGGVAHVTFVFQRKKGIREHCCLLFGTEASAKGREIRSREILIDSPTSSVGLQLCVLLFNSNKQALMNGF